MDKPLDNSKSNYILANVYCDKDRIYNLVPVSSARNFVRKNKDKNCYFIGVNINVYKSFIKEKQNRHKKTWYIVNTANIPEDIDITSIQKSDTPQGWEPEIGKLMLFGVYSFPMTPDKKRIHPIELLPNTITEYTL